MRSARGVAAAMAISVVLIGSISGCSVSGCSGARQSTASVSVDVTAWSSAHPGHTLSVCLDTMCKDVTTMDSITASSSEPSGHAFAIRVTDTTSKQVVGQATSRLSEGREETACGDVSYPTGTVTVEGDGRLSIT
ncbi:hypothetical protein [Curtobacterium sp. MCBA15_004]|uniref:hypothetical protein n=1 Tax=unclassified Curtobacterium TaxID=257496 RepID=UPI0020C894BF|nr:hypothetical protein [Curtobacterium sp. MCBA15_004]WIA98000.1 hypothetical protein QOL16_06335 [Curtobacterium sp. MCBA15_004]